MANDQESNSRFDPSTTPRLQYPTFPPLSRSVEEWLSQSRPTMSTSPLQPERSSSALSESWATLSTSDIHSEDETRSEQTDIASLIDQNGPDDVASLDDRASSSYTDDNDANEDDVVDNYGAEDDDEDNDAESAVSDSQMLPRPLFARDFDLPAVDDSSLTTRTTLFHPSESIEFSEPEKWPEVQRVELKHTISILDDQETAILKDQLPMNLADDCQLAITVQQTMTKQGLDLDKPFRVLYMGNPEFRNIILDKIGDVLVSSSTHSLGSSSTESSRYHVVPTSFGVGATPNYAELLPIHVQLIVDECLDAVSEARRTLNHSNITLHFKNRPSCTSVWTGFEHQIGSENEWTLPDLSIFLISDRDSEDNVRARHVAQSFMKTHGIPILIISEEPLWKKNGQRLFPFDHQGLHLCLESRRSLTGESVVVERYPIDVKTFESITPSQLNRHLASLSELHPKKQPSSSTTLPLTKPLESKAFYDAEKYPTASILACSGRAPDFAPWLRLVMLSIVLAISVSLGYTVFRAIAIFLLQFYARFAMSSSSDANLVPSTTMATAIMPSTNSLTSLSLKDQITDLTVSNMGDFSEISQLLTDRQAKNDDTFQFQVIGDCHVIIKQPVATKNNRFDIKVTRGSVSLPYELAKLFDGVYTLRLNREDAYGLVNVSVSSRSRQPREQSLEVDFGTPWLKIENWKRAAQTVSSQIRRDLDSAQTGLSDIYARLSTDVQVWMGDVVKKSHTIRQEAESLRVDDRQFKASLDAIITRSKEISNIITRSTSQQFKVATTVLEKIHKQSIALNKEARDIINATRSFWGTRSNDLHILKNSIQDAIAMPSCSSPSSFLVRAQKSAKKLTEQNLRRFTKLLQRPRE
ncbi:hypothetical protein UA08_03485 [Talaromyces atroroseus]|uniref:Uncharacterized protein n=1 Tax=Talaromyces atroroseus TaxID=1441469 RepID=A0A225AK33_TALAT|nr:hypothetical protein UA08_03485 [Talaromyces atroroseus]OKL61230.1 hypothetical protein UA08_03485 [Talaromyces atroroseus]